METVLWLANGPQALGEAYATLLRVRGLGEWTARHAPLKAFRHPADAPFGAAGIGQALRRRNGFALPLGRPATEIFFGRFGAWQAYLVFYLWRWLAQPAEPKAAGTTARTAA